MEILLKSDHTILIDECDYDRVAGRCIFADKRKDGNYYAKIYSHTTRDRKVHNVYLHHWLFGKGLKGFYVDHINGNRLDNRKNNLRFVTRGQNNTNSIKRRKNITSKYKWVSFNKILNKWCVFIREDGTTCYKGKFDTEKEAAINANIHALNLYGEHARLNVIEDES